MKIGSWERTLRPILSLGVAMLALGLLWLFLATEQPAMATAPIVGDPVSTQDAVSILTVSDGVTAVVAADLDNDGLIDLAFNDGNDVRIVANESTTATVSWMPSATVVTMNAPVADLSAADFDRDGLVDLAVATRDGSGVSDLRLVRNPGSPFITAWSQSQTLTSAVQLSLASLVAGDLDGDGRADLVAAGGDGVIRLWRNPLTGTQSFSAWGSPAQIATGDGAIAQLALADVDHDGYFDIVAISGGSTPRVRIWRNPATPFSSAWSTTNLLGNLGADGVSLAVSDLDHDGWLDVAAGAADGSIRAWHNPLTATRPFTTSWGSAVPIESGSGRVEVLQAADLDDDGYPELLRGTGGISPSLVIWHSGRAPFAGTWLSHTAGAPGRALHALAVADLDRDGDVDLVSGDAGALLHWSNVLVHRSAPFGSAVLLGAQNSIEALAVGDLDRDGLPDLVTISSGGAIRLWRNDGSPFVSGWPSISWTYYQNMRSLAVGDLDGDGDLDLVTGHSDSSRRLRVWRNDGTPFDDTGGWDGTVIGSVPHGDFANTWASALATGDLDRDGAIDIVVGTGSDFGPAITDPVSRSTDFGLLAWYHSGDPFSSTGWSTSTISVTLDAVNAIALGDLDNDGWLDVVAGTNHPPSVGTITNPMTSTWFNAYSLRAFRNDGTPSDSHWAGVNVGRDPETYTFASPIAPYHGFYGARTFAVVLADLDNDGDLDIASGDGWEADYQVKVWENDDTPFDGALWDFSVTGLGSEWPQKPNPWLDEADVRSLAAADIDGDGLVDLVSGHEFGAVIHWENDGYPFSAVPTDVHWIRHTVGNLSGRSVEGTVAADLDRDGDLDLANSIRISGDSVYAWQNRGGAVGEHATGTAPAEMVEDAQEDLMRVAVTHNGKWVDHDVELDWWRLTLADGTGAPLTGAQAASLFDDVGIYRDNGNDVWQGAPTDALVVSVTVTGTAVGSGGVLTIAFPAGETLSSGGQETYFVVATLQPDASLHEPSAFQVVFDADAASVVRDYTTLSSVSIEDTDPVSVGPVSILAGPPAAVSLVASSSAIVADGSSTAVITATVTNARGHPVEDGTDVAFTSTLGSISPSAVTSGGVATGVLTSSVGLGTANVTATAGGVSGHTSVEFVPGPPDEVVATAWPDRIVADGSSTAVVTATVTDALDRPVADGTGVSFSTTLGDVTPSALTSGGVATAVLTSSTGLGTANVTATAGGVSDGASVEFVLGPPDEVVATAWPDRIVADGVSTAVVTATVTDVMDRPVADGTGVSFSTTLGEIAPSALTSGGVATAVLTSSVGLGTANVTATAGGVSGGASVEFVLGPPDEVVAAAWPDRIVADGISTAVVTATVTDALDRPVADGTGVSFSTTLGEVSPSALTSGGVATAVLTSSTGLGTANVTATAGGVSDGASVEFVLGPPDEVAVTAWPDRIVADGVSTAVVTATVTDALDRPVADGTSVSFSTTLGEIAPSALASGGVATAVLTSSVGLGTANVTATAGGVSGGTSVEFVLGPPDEVVVAAWPDRIVADGVSTAVVTATVTDALDRPVADGTSVSFSTTLGEIAPSAVTSGGVATAVLTSSTELGTAVVTATAGSVSGGASVEFVPGPMAELAVVAVPDRIVADGVSTAVITTTAMDAQGHRVAGEVTVNFATTLGSIAPPARLTSGAVATATLTSSTELGTAIVTATAGSFGGSASVDFVPGPPTTISVTAVPTSVVADGSSTAVVTATVTDALDRPVADGTSVSFSTTLGEVSPSAVTSGGGATAVLTSSTELGTAVITATVGGGGGQAEVGGQARVRFVIGPFAQVIVVAEPSTLVADGESTSVISATLAGAGGHPITETRTVVFTTTLGSILPLTRSTSSGIATATLQVSKTTGIARVTAWADGISGHTDVIFGSGTSYIYLPLAVRN